MFLRTFDPANSGHIGENEFRKIMKSKEGIPDEDIEEMLEGDWLTFYQVDLNFTFKLTDTNRNVDTDTNIPILVPVSHCMPNLYILQSTKGWR